jgi:hypothetical protein
MSGELTSVRQDERRLLLKWVLANAAGFLVVPAVVFVVITILALGMGIAEPEEIIAGMESSGTVLNGLLAFLLGTMQWLVLRQRSYRYLTWVGATVGGEILYSVLFSVGLNPAWSQSPGIWDNMAAGTLSGEELALVDKVREEYRRLAPVPCTNCKYCMPCPNGVEIADILKYYNDALIYDNLRAPRFLYGTLSKDRQADNCVECFECEEKCPQGIPIAEQLKKAHGLLG